MKILVVNAYPQTSKGQASFSRFYDAVKETFSKQSVFFDLSFEILVKTNDDLDDILYDESHSYVKKGAAHTFDRLDMVFIEGDVNVLPWSPSMSKISILLRMCLKAKKTLFASAFAMQALVYLTATNLETDINVINGKGKGGKLEDIHTLNIDLDEIKHNDYFLDRVAGDLYSYNHDLGEWTPTMNIGIHHKRSALDPNNSLCKYMQKPQSVQQRIFKGKGNTVVTNTNIEDYCQVKHLYCQHFALKTLPLEFVVPMKNNWDIHNFNFVNPYKTFVVMAETKKTPQIIYFEPHCVGTLFEVTKTYPETFDILQNFVNAKLHEIKEDDKHKGISILHAIELHKGIPNNYFKLSSRAQARHYQEVNETKKISVLKNERLGLTESVVRPNTNKVFHVGHAFTRHHEAPLIVENNTLRKDLTIKIVEPKRTATSFMIRTTKASSGQETRGPSIKSMPNLDYKSKTNSRPISTSHGYNKAFVTGTLTSTDDNSTTNSGGNSIKRNSHQSERKSQTVGSLDSLDEKSIERTSVEKYMTEPQTIKSLTRAEIVKIIYPTMPEESLYVKDAWVPGQLSKRLQDRAVSSDGRKVVKVKTENPLKFYTNYKKFKEINVDEARSKLWVRTSSEYISEHDRLKAEEKENDKKLISHKFLRFGGKGTKQNYIENYINQPISDPVLLHNFREPQKEKWLYGNMKFY